MDVRERGDMCGEDTTSMGKWYQERREKSKRRFRKTYKIVCVGEA